MVLSGHLGEQHHSELKISSPDKCQSLGSFSQELAPLKGRMKIVALPGSVTGDVAPKLGRVKMIPEASSSHHRAPFGKPRSFRIIP
jgi:hypothetical protein